MTDFYDAVADELDGIDRSFTFAGVEFKIKPVAPADVSADIAEIQLDRLTDNYYDAIVSIVRRYLRPEYRKRWDDFLAAEREIPITLDMLSNLVAHLVNEETAILEERVGRPTQPPSPSGNTGGSTTTKSTGTSDSPAPAKGSETLRSVPV